MKKVSESESGVVALQPQYYSLAQLAHFADVEKHKEGLRQDLLGWTWDTLRNAVITGQRLPHINDIENTDGLKILQSHLKSPDLWRWWEELKRKVILIENKWESIWNEMLTKAKEQTGLDLTLQGVQSEMTQKGITADFFTIILYEQEQRTLGEFSYSSGVEESLIWASVGGEQPKEVPAVIPRRVGQLQGSPSVPTSEKVKTIGIGRLPKAVKYPSAAHFFLRLATHEIAFLQSPDELPKVQHVHKQLRSDYGPKLSELIGQCEHIRDLLYVFVTQLKAVEVSRDLYPCCPDFHP